MMRGSCRIVRAGDSVLIAELEPRIDPAVNARVIAMAAAIASAQHPGVRDVVPTYRSVTVYFDPLRTDATALEDLVTREAARPARPAPPATRASRPIEIPVCYGGTFGPDLADVAARAGCTEAEVIALHSGREYRVYMLGFVPGFAYLGLVDERIAMPRHETPRLRVPARSVGMTGFQTGIYPSETPGGWQIIGRTPIEPFDPSRPEPFLLAAGDGVTFTPITPDDYERLSAAEPPSREMPVGPPSNHAAD